MCADCHAKFVIFDFGLYKINIENNWINVLIFPDTRVSPIWPLHAAACALYQPEHIQAWSSSSHGQYTPCGKKNSLNSPCSFLILTWLSYTKCTKENPQWKIPVMEPLSYRGARHSKLSRIMWRDCRVWVVSWSDWTDLCATGTGCPAFPEGLRDVTKDWTLRLC